MDSCARIGYLLLLNRMINTRKSARITRVTGNPAVFVGFGGTSGGMSGGDAVCLTGAGCPANG